MPIHLASLGCRLNEAELEQWTRLLTDSGHTLTSTPTDASTIVLNTCAVTTEAARKSRHLIRRLHRDNPTAQLIITGCYAHLSRAQIESLPGVSLVLDNLQKDFLVDHIPPPPPAPPPDPPTPANAADDWQPFAASRTRAFIKVQDGCRNRCTFCIVTIARGQERSRPLADIIAEVNDLHHRHGYQEVVLAGVHLGGYGSDLDCSLADLVDALLAHTTIPRIRLGSLEPWDIPPNFWTRWPASGGRLCPHLHLPLQSGCDATLKRMARRCDTERFSALTADARAHIPHLSISTDLIVGFPGETDDEWTQTLSFIRTQSFSHIHLFTYSPRPGTTAARMRDHVPPATAQARMHQAQAAAQHMKRAHLEAQVGSMTEVLWEGEPTPSPDQSLWRWEGYTDNFLRVVADSPPQTHLRGTRALTLLTDLSPDLQHLQGQILRWN